MRALCVVLLVLVTVKAEDGDDGDGGVVLGCEGGGEDPENSDNPEGSVAESEKSDEEDLAKSFGIDIENIKKDVCNNFTELNRAVYAVIDKDNDTKAKLDENPDCMCIRMAVKILEGKTSPMSFTKAYHAFTAIQDGLSDTNIAEQLWREENFKEGEKGGIMSDLLGIAIRREGVKLGHGCAKNDRMAVCTFAPPVELLKVFEEEAEEWLEFLRLLDKEDVPKKA
ncbi:unnamed protein product [Cylicocyclus nassatus]|uniref:SCP domain-containing protein n=1 Tax=Cylicocyclus nassatus TaxID=53992 RepID=A0AA36DQ58_CYLNA|nr:unnamed protein product [Cylicocyclus nassatus]